MSINYKIFIELQCLHVLSSLSKEKVTRVLFFLIRNCFMHSLLVERGSLFDVLTMYIPLHSYERTLWEAQFQQVFAYTIWERSVKQEH